MYLIGATGNFSNRSHRSMQHDCIGSPDAQHPKLIRQFLHRVHNKLNLSRVRSSLIRANASNVG
jgi:hypothetical protein